MSLARDRRIARRVAELLQDGRPRGCKCPPDVGVYALPCDNKHTGSPRCPLTRPQEDELAELRKRVDDLTVALQMLAPLQKDTTNGS